MKFEKFEDIEIDGTEEEESKEKKETDDLIKAAEETTEPILEKKKVFGWICFCIAFNILNVVVYSSIYPKMLENQQPTSHQKIFSFNNTITTIFSALFIPVLGSFVDELRAIKSTMVLTFGLGLLFTFGKKKKKKKII